MPPGEFDPDLHALSGEISRLERSADAFPMPGPQPPNADLILIDQTLQRLERILQ